ncbi:ABC transporter permease subunit [Streptomyces sp. S.PB5]|uniref:ABC transporter permease subunit n=1 Tax=Streptomyces sp. S.PB5 TaxID=3020844 RepID=UPI0025B02B83|nr:ABC transporter permease subunit [Streptomyces sp. S.PB5]MDN3028792.1 ABC transporter permease subunit [Streptomyces sp. S.PB5]
MNAGRVRTVLRLHRTALIVWAVFVLGSVGYLVWLTEVTADDVHATLAACRDTPSNYCGLWASQDFSGPMGWISTFMYYGFWAVAAWSAAALIGRELESGTARLAWTQGVTPARWLAAKLTVPALVLIAGGLLFVPVFRWAWSAHRDLMGDHWGFADVFAARGPLVVAYGLCALAVGTLTALAVRRSLPASAIALALVIVLNRYVEKHRDEYWPPVSGDGRELPDTVWQLGGGDYHPPSHFWPLHLVETGIVLAVAAAAAVAAFLLLRHRTAPARTPRQESPA